MGLNALKGYFSSKHYKILIVLRNLARNDLIDHLNISKQHLDSYFFHEIIKLE